MKRSLILFIVVLATTCVFGVGEALADRVQYGNFQISLDRDGKPSWNSSGNDGFEQMWYEYPPQTSMGKQGQTPVPQTWWNEWWYDGKLVIPGDKIINLSFYWKPLNETPGVLEPVAFHVTINWSNSMWGPGLGTPPIPGHGYDPEKYIGRYTPIQFDYMPGEAGYEGTGVNDPYKTGNFSLGLGYNPEWISVDVRGVNVAIWGGVIEHTCVPIPGALLLLGSGLIGLVGLRKKIT